MQRCRPGSSWQEIEALPQPLRWAVQRTIFHLLYEPAALNAPLTAWAPSDVTLLGYAIHNMTPMAGVGANTALCDADELRQALLAPGPQDLTARVGGYEERMRGYAHPAGRAGQNQLMCCPAGAAVRGAVGRDPQGEAWPAVYPGCRRRPPPPSGPARPDAPGPPGGLRR